MSTMRRRPYVTTRTHEVFAIAHDVADQLGHEDVTPLHICIGLIREGRSIAAQIVQVRGVRLDALHDELEAHLPPIGEPRVPAREHAWTLSDESILEHATREGRELGAEFVGCEHVLLAFLRDPATVSAQLLAQHGVRFEDVRTEVLRAYNARPDGWTSPGSSPAV
ncbi:MAG: Clp protease N-terminal domain-containing protein [Gemmatimonadaceae bacterium]